MKTKDILQETYTALSANKVRSGLTVLGIVIGISSVIAMVSIGQGAKASIESSIQSIGSNLIMVYPGQQRGPGFQVSSGRGSARTLTQGDADAVKEQITDAELVAAELSSRYQISTKGKNTNTAVNGTVPEYTEVKNVQIDYGTFFNEQHLRSLAKVAVIGPTTKTDLFGEDIEAIGQVIRINSIPFIVIGVTQAKGGSGFNNQDDMVFIPLTTAQRYLAGDNYVSLINIKAKNTESMSAIQEQVTSLLLERHRIEDPAQADFSTFNQADIVATASNVASTFTILLGAVAGISLVVGGIGIMNMMLTTVTERTREIGLRKAIGANKKDIEKQFLIEAIALTLIGGIIGVLLGVGISYLVNALGVLQTSVSPESILLAFGVSAGIGILFGYYPARRAAHLNPIEALRYE